MDCVLLEVELAVELLSALQELELTELAVRIILGWELPVQAVVSGLEMLSFGVGAGGACPAV